MIRKPSADRRAGCKGVENEEDQAAFLYFGNYDNLTMPDRRYISKKNHGITVLWKPTVFRKVH